MENCKKEKVIYMVLKSKDKEMGISILTSKSVFAPIHMRSAVMISFIIDYYLKLVSTI